MSTTMPDDDEGLKGSAALLEWSDTSVVGSEHTGSHPSSEYVGTTKKLEHRSAPKFSATIAVLPPLPEDTVRDNFATEVSLPPIERRSTVSTMTVGQSDQTTDTGISMELDEEGETDAPETDVAPIVAVPIPTDREAVDAVVVSIVERSKKKLPLAAKRRRNFLIFCVVAFAVLLVSVVAGVCGSGGCARSGTDEKDDSPQTLPPPELDDRTIAFFSHINNVTFGRALSPYDNDTIPEIQALNWLIDVDPLQLDPLNNSFRIHQRYALATFWFHSNNTGDWLNSTGWLDYDDECSWFGISCSNIYHGPDTGLQMTVTSMELRSNRIKGIIPSDLGLLSNLQNFSLDTNQLQGSIPEWIGQWTNLETLQLQFNEAMTGQIPESIGNLHRLVNADFSFNQFSGQLPSSIGQWTDLVTIDFSYLSINGTIPSSVGNWKNLERCLMLDSDFYGTLPDSIGNWGNLQFLLLGGNHFSGALPPEISNWTHLIILDVSFNEFSGTIPEGVLNWTSIQQMYLFETELTGSVPEGMCILSNLTSLEADCSSKNITCSCCSLCN